MLSLLMNKVWMKRVLIKMEFLRSFWRRRYLKCLILFLVCLRYVDFLGFELYVLKGFEDVFYIFLLFLKIKEFYVLFFFFKLFMKI